MLAESLNQLAAPIRNEFLEMYSSPMVGLPDREEGTTILQNAMYLLVTFIVIWELQQYYQYNA